MKLSRYFKGFTTFIIFYSLSVNASSNQCDKLKDVAYHCKEDENGNIYTVSFEIGINNDNDKAIKKIVSYKSINEIYIKTEYKAKLYQNIIDKLGELTNLKSIDISADFEENLNFEPFGKLKNLTKATAHGTNDKLPKHIFKYLKNLKELSIGLAKLNKNDVSDINSLTKLEKLRLFDISFEKNLDYNFSIKELSLSYCTLEKNFFKSLKNLKILIDSEYNKLEQYHIDEISTLPNLEEIILDKIDKENKLNINVLKNLKNLKSCDLSVDCDYLKYVKDVKHLILNARNLSKSCVKELGNMTNIDELRITINDETRDFDYSPLQKNINLTSLILHGDSDSVRDPMSKLNKNTLKGFKNLKKLELIQIDFEQSYIDDIANLILLETLNVNDCYWLKQDKFINIDPLNKLSNLRYIDIAFDTFKTDFNEPMKTLTNDKLEKCNYFVYPPELICISKDMKCFSKEFKKEYKLCSETVEKISTNGKCGKEDGKCPSDKCCSKYGYCGTSDKHCLSGCQSEFGKCKNNTTKKTSSTKTTKKTSSTKTTKKTSSTKTTKKTSSTKTTKKTTTTKTTKKTTTTTTTKKTTKKTTSTKKTTKTSYPTSTNGLCGKEVGKRCPSGKCCSKYGYCGTSNKHCFSGCQSEFGKCK